MIHVFIVNPQAGRKKFAGNIREILQKKEGFDYFIFNTRNKRTEVELVKLIEEMFEDETIRYYCCGGSGTVRNVMSGITNLDKAQIAFYPCGLTNDFLKVFGKDEERFRNIDELIDGEVIDIDYMKTNQGVCLNTVSFGMDTNTIEYVEQFNFLRVLGDDLPYTMSIFASILAAKPVQYEIETERGIVQRPSVELFYGNGFCVGGNLFFVKETDVTDGTGYVRVCRAGSLFKLLEVFKSLLDKNYKKLNEISQSWYTSFLKVRRTDGQPFAVNQDGELTEELTEWNVEIVKQGLHFVVPKGVRPI